jgi:hypothetical protein
VETEYFLFNNSGKRQIVEEVREVFPHISITVFPEAFIVKTIDLSNLTRFMVSTKYSDSVLVANLEAHEKSHGLN